MQIVDLKADDQAAIQQTVSLLGEVFPGWIKSRADGLAEVLESFQPGHVSRIAVDQTGLVLGWVGAISRYDGHVWEVHPLLVRPDRQRQGIGRALLADLEAVVRAHGAITLYLGTDDVDRQTSLGGIDLYPDIAHHIATIKNVRQHSFAFYQKVGFVIMGLLPDANGFGKPDILMAKRVGPVSDEG